MRRAATCYLDARWPASCGSRGSRARARPRSRRGLAPRLGEAGVAAALLDAEELRARWPERYGHDPASRRAVLERIVDEAAAESARGVVAVVATISHRASMRASARARLRLFEVLVDCPPEVCAARDVKGHWARAFAAQSSGGPGDYGCFPGVTEPYERGAPDLRVDTASLDAERALDEAWPPVLAFARAT